ncbi:MAG: transcriptional regulator [Actinomycetaceae bacterium]|nr:transcriptional regulator [Actinomycetaceae bacterium]
MTVRYLSATEAAARLGIRPASFHSYVRKGLTPEPDALVGDVRGWLPETIDEWNKHRPGRGARTDLHGQR